MDPEHFPDVFGDLAKPFLAVAQGDFRLDASGDLALQSLIDGEQLGGAFPDSRFRVGAGGLRLFLGRVSRGDVSDDAENADDGTIGVPVGPFDRKQDPGCLLYTSRCV